MNDRSFVVRLYRTLLRLYPASFREEYGDQMEQAFRSQYETVSSNPDRSTRRRLWAGVLLDTARVAPKENLDTLRRDLCYSGRVLAKHPGFTLTAVLTLALGIGANTAVFSVVNGVVVQQLPYPHADRLAMVYVNATEAVGVPKLRFSIADYFDWRDHDRHFEEIAVFGTMGNRFNLTGHGEPQQVQGMYASGRFFSVLGVTPLIGRDFRSEDDDRRGPPAVVLRESLWRSRFGSDPGAVGQLIGINGTQHVVIGVVSDAFRFPSRDTELWAVLPMAPPTRRGPYFLRGIGRLKAGSTVADAEASLAAVPIGVKVGAQPGATTTRFVVVGLHDELVGDVALMLFFLLGAVVVVLLIATVNVANLFLARAAGRAHEIAVRLSLGASPKQIVRQLLTESMLLTVIGGMTGLALAYGGLHVLRMLSPQDLPRIDELAIDGTVLLFTLVASIASGATFGVFPAIRVLQSGAGGGLQEPARGSISGPTQDRLRRGLVVVEVALSFVLLVGAGLLIRSFDRLHQMELGFSSNNLLTVHISPLGERYRNDEITRNFYQELAARLETTPGIRSVGLTNTIPAGGGGFAETFTIEGREGDANPSVLTPAVTPGYFRALGIPLVVGRYFDAGDKANSLPVAIISETMAKRYFADADPVGKRMRVGGPERPNVPWMEIVGVVRDVRYHGFGRTPEPIFYRPHAQQTVRSMFIVARTSVPVSSVAGPIRSVVHSLDGELAVPLPPTMDQLLFESVAAPRFRTILLTIFAAVGLLLAIVGIYGVISYTVVLRVPEIGVRMALGARRRDIAVMIVRDGLRLAVVGFAIGFAGSLALSRFVESFLFEIRSTDPPTLLGVTAVCLSAALLASALPALRAARLNPLSALRHS